jgi:poly(A) polymerase Pap1
MQTTIHQKYISAYFKSQHINQEEQTKLQTLREEAFTHLTQILTTFFTDLFNTEKPYTRSQFSPAFTVKDIFKLLQFGSSLFNAQDAESDIDCLLLTYDIIMDRREYFALLAPYIDGLQKDGTGDILNVLEVREANVPIIKFQCKGVKIDLIFACAFMTPFLKFPESNYLLQFHNYSEDDKANFCSTMGY